MRRGRKIGLGVLGCFVAMLVMGLVLPRTFDVERSIVVDAEVDDVYTLASDLKNHPLWNARRMRDPSMRFSFPVRAHAGVGATYEWTSEKSENGKLTITKAEPGRSLTISVCVEKKGDGTAVWRFEPDGNRTRVTRRFKGEIPVPVLGPFILLAVRPQDKLGADVELELEVFRRIAEGAVLSQ